MGILSKYKTKPGETVLLIDKLQGRMSLGMKETGIIYGVEQIIALLKQNEYDLNKIDLGFEFVDSLRICLESNKNGEFYNLNINKQMEMILEEIDEWWKWFCKDGSDLELSRYIKFVP